MSIAVGKKVNIDGFEEETGDIVVQDEDNPKRTRTIRVNSLRLPGKVKEFSDMPPGEDRGSHPGDEPDPSPHYLVTLKDADGNSHDVWFCAPRVREV